MSRKTKLRILEAFVWIVLIVFAWLPAGCAKLTEAEMQVRTQQTQIILDGLKESGFEGRAVAIIEEQPLRAGLWNGFTMDSPIRVQIILMAELEPDEGGTGPLPEEPE